MPLNLKLDNPKPKKMPTPKTAKRIGVSIKKEKINPGDYLKYDHRLSCEDCTYFKPEPQTCSLGFQTENHKKSTQTKDYELSGRVAICRFLEID